MPAGLGGSNVFNDDDSDDNAKPTHGKVNHLAVESKAPDADGDDDEEDDYMTFALPDDTAGKPAAETSLQRAARLKREAAARARPLSKAELAQQEALRREEALLTSLDQSNRGFKMLAKFGFKPGDALGPASRAPPPSTTTTDTAVAASADTTAAATPPDTRLREPLAVEFKQGREGIGLANTQKRAFRAEAEARLQGEKRRKVEAGDYRVRQAQERDERRCEGLLLGAQKVAIGLVDDARPAVARDAEEEEEEDEDEEEAGGGGVALAEEDAKPLRVINVLWRGLIKERRERDRERRMRVDLVNSLSRRPGYEANADEEAQDELAYDGKKDDTKGRKEQVLESELDDEDEELAEFQALSAKERLARIVAYLREQWQYCFWCKMRYEDKALEGCPGSEEDDHD